MIIWSGKGERVLLFWMILCIPLFILMKFGEYFPDAHFLILAKQFAKIHLRWLSGGCLILMGIVDWFYGRHLNGQPARVGIDPMTGIQKTFHPNHALFWIKIEYWGLAFIAAGFYIVVFWKR